MFEEIMVDLEVEQNVETPSPGFRTKSISSSAITCSRVKSGIFRHQMNSDSDLVCFIF